MEPGFTSAIDYRRLFEALPGSVAVVLPDDPGFTMVAASDDYLHAAGKPRHEMMGRSLFEVFHGPDPTQSTTLTNLRASFQRVLTSRQPDRMPVQQYNQQSPSSEGAAFEERFWSPLNSPILAPDGSVQFIIHRVEDVTELVLRSRELDHAKQVTEERKRVAEELRRYQEFFESAPVGLAVGLTDGTFGTVNPAFARMHQSSAEELAGTPIASVFAPEELPSLNQGIRKADETGHHSWETVHVRKDGSRFPVAIDLTGVRDEQDRLLYRVAGITDITERKAAEQAVLQSEERFRLLAENIADIFWLTDYPQTRILYVSPAFSRLSGLPESAFSTGIEAWKRQIHPEDAERVRTEFDCNMPHGKFNTEYRIIRPDGEQRWISDRAFPVRDGSGNIHRVAGVTQDITARKRAEQELRQQWLAFDTALSNTPDFTYTFDLEGRFSYVNRGLLALLQLPLEAAVGKNFFELNYPAALAQRLHQQIRQVIETRAPVRDETPFTSPSGETRDYEYIFVPVLGSAGRVEAVAGSTRDITDRHHAEEALRKSEQRLTLTLEAAAGVGTWDWDVQNDRVYCSPHFARFFSVDPDRAAAGVPIVEFLTGTHPDDRGMVFDKIQRASETGGEYAAEYRVLPKDGPMRWLGARGRVYPDPSGRPARFTGVAIDITERKLAEQAQRESEARLRAIYDGTYEYIGLLAPDGTLLETNRASLAFAGNTREDVIGRLFWETPWFAQTPDASEAVRNAVVRAAAGEFVRFEARVRRPSGEIPTFDLSFHPVRSETGEVILIVPEGRDITERKRAEEELVRFNQELTRANSELEEFAYVASHDLQEPLRMVNIYSQLLLKRIGQDADAELQQFAGYVRTGVKRMETLIRDLLTYSKTTHADAGDFQGRADLNAALEQALTHVAAAVEQSAAEVTFDHLPVVAGDQGQMAHVFQNLLSNALKYTKPGERPRIHIGVTRQDGHCVVMVKDHGIGFNPVHADRIFGLFKRLHPEGDYPGTGVGLAICKRIVERHRGRIWAESQLGHGAAFFIALPEI